MSIDQSSKIRMLLKEIKIWNVLAPNSLLMASHFWPPTEEFWKCFVTKARGASEPLYNTLETSPIHLHLGVRFMALGLLV